MSTSTRISTNQVAVKPTNDSFAIGALRKERVRDCLCIIRICLLEPCSLRFDHTVRHRA